MYYLYILKSIKDNKYYIGSTNDINRRIVEHNRGQTRSTRYRRPFLLALKKQYNTKIEANLIERKLKSYKNSEIIDKIVKSGVISDHSSIG